MGYKTFFPSKTNKYIKVLYTGKIKYNEQKLFGKLNDSQRVNNKI